MARLANGARRRDPRLGRAPLRRARKVAWAAARSSSSPRLAQSRPRRGRGWQALVVVAGPRRTSGAPRGARWQGMQAGRRAGAGRQAGRQAGVSARNGARMRPCRRRPRWVVGGWHGRRRLIRLSMIGTASSAVDRDSLACVRCSPSRAPHRLAAAQDDSSRTRHGTRGGATAAAVAAAAARGSERGCKAGARPVAALRDLVAGSWRTVTSSVLLPG